jgi:hypothetical protein
MNFYFSDTQILQIIKPKLKFLVIIKDLPPDYIRFLILNQTNNHFGYFIEIPFLSNKMENNFLSHHDV